MDKRRSLSGAALIAGTSIGGGMLALPILTGQGGFFPSLLVYFISWAFMLATGLLFLELAFYFPKEAHFITYTLAFFGIPGAFIVGALYLFLFYCLTFAYIVGISDLIICVFPNMFPGSASIAVAVATFLIVLLGAKKVGAMNSLFFLLLVGSFLLFLVFGFHFIDFRRLFYVDWSRVPMGLPVAFTAFAYQGTVPTLVSYLDRDKVACRRALFLGTAIPFIIYIVWQVLILGILPVEGKGGLIQALEKGECAVIPLESVIESRGFLLLSDIFAFSALFTSLIGVSLGLGDFLKDSFSLKRSFSAFFVALPPLIMAINTKGLFLEALDSAGGIGCSLLLGFLPISLVFWLRYKKKAVATRFLPGGKTALIMLFAIFILEFYFYLK